MGEGYKYGKHDPFWTRWREICAALNGRVKGIPFCCDSGQLAEAARRKRSHEKAKALTRLDTDSAERKV